MVSGPVRLERSINRCLFISERQIRQNVRDGDNMPVCLCCPNLLVSMFFIIVHAWDRSRSKRLVDIHHYGFIFYGAYIWQPPIRCYGTDGRDRRDRINHDRVPHDRHKPDGWYHLLSVYGG